MAIMGVPMTTSTLLFLLVIDNFESAANSLVGIVATQKVTDHFAICCWSSNFDCHCKCATTQQTPGCLWNYLPVLLHCYTCRMDLKLVSSWGGQLLQSGVAWNIASWTRVGDNRSKLHTGNQPRSQKSVRRNSTNTSSHRTRRAKPHHSLIILLMLINICILHDEQSGYQHGSMSIG